VGPIGFSMYGLTNEENPVPLHKAVAILEHCYDIGIRFWTGSLDYGTQRYNSMHILNQYFDLHPDHIDKVVINIKASWEPLKHRSGISSFDARKGLEQEIKRMLELAGKRKYITIFTPTRLRPDCKLAEIVMELQYWRNWNAIKGIGLCEASAEAIECADLMIDVALVEVEMSVISPEPAKKGILDMCERLGIPVIAGAPLSHGLLTSSPPSSLSENDHRHELPRFQETNFAKNRSLAVRTLRELAHQFFDNRTISELSLAWIHSKGALAVPSSTNLEHI
ncbi:NADP-dependent oxidoreductase domain-containing protein, partial [Lophiotrema nucula]